MCVGKLCGLRSYYTVIQFKNTILLNGINLFQLAMSGSQSDFVAISVRPKNRQRLRILKAEEEYPNYDSILQTFLKNTEN